MSKKRTRRSFTDGPSEQTIAKYSLDDGEYEEMLERQMGSCAICRREFSDDLVPVVDHCHEWGHVRALLCNRCNVLLGTGRDQQELLFAAVAYLGKHDPLACKEEYDGLPGSPYKRRGYSATHGSYDSGDYLTISRHGRVIAEVQVAVLPEGPDAPASINIRRFSRREFRRVRVFDDVEGDD